MLGAVILCGGLGTRLRARVADRPKALALVQGRPFLSHQLDWLAGNGLFDVTLAAGYLGDQIKEFARDLRDGRFSRPWFARLSHSAVAALSSMRCRREGPRPICIWS